MAGLLDYNKTEKFRRRVTRCLDRQLSLYQNGKVYPDADGAIMLKLAKWLARAERLKLLDWKRAHTDAWVTRSGLGERVTIFVDFYHQNFARSIGSH